MDQHTLELAIRGDPILKNTYKGCFCRDEIPNIANNSVYLINTALSSSVGEHWVAIDTCHEGKIFWLCSYHTNPRQFKLIWIRICATKRALYTFPRRLQAPVLTNCGPFILFFLYMTSRGLTPEDMMKQYFENRDIYKNSVLVTEVSRVLFRLTDTVEDLLFDSGFSLEQKKKKFDGQ